MRVSTGVDGLDDVLHGGLPAGCNHLVRGGPGAGKTTLSLHFLCQGLAGDEGLDVSLTLASGPRPGGRRHGRPRHHPSVGPRPQFPLGLPDATETVIEDHLFRPNRERTPVVQAVLGHARSQRPRRVVVDSLTRLWELIPDVHEFRREVLALVRGLAEVGATVLSTSEFTPRTPDDELQFIADGVLQLELEGELTKAIGVLKKRTSGFKKPLRQLRITPEGLQVGQPLHHLRGLLSGVPELVAPAGSPDGHA